MNRADFPVIGPSEASAYIRSARLTPNAIALRIRQLVARPVMHRRCSWCNCDLGDVSCAQAMAGRTSHGICERCADLNFPQQVASEAGESHTLCQVGSAPTPAPNFTAVDAGSQLGVAGGSGELGGGDPSFPVPVLADVPAAVALRDSADTIARGAHAFTVRAEGPRGGEKLSSAIGAHSSKCDEADDIKSTSPCPALD